MEIQDAVDLLLDPQKNGWLLSSSAGALVKVAQGGNDQAIEFMRQLTIDPANAGLWNFAAEGLIPAAESGNEVAVTGFDQHG
jgi:hypothetical protein